VKSQLHSSFDRPEKSTLPPPPTVQAEANCEDFSPKTSRQDRANVCGQCGRDTASSQRADTQFNLQTLRTGHPVFHRLTVFHESISAIKNLIISRS
jgi:hypothetical protein